MSEQYIVSARKYRPQTFDTVVGQQHITTTLKNAIRTQHLAHAYLFCGPRGVGKTTCARILARTINCESPTPDMEACGQCTTCLSFQDNTSFNVFELDAASNNSVDDIRALTEQVRYAPQVGRYKIYIIDEVHMLSSAAFNAFLKTLEEPPSYAIFILATTEKHKILPTILSRCQIFDFKRIQTEDIVGHLNSICVKEHTIADNAALHIIAQKSEGCMRDALSMMDRIASFTSGQLTYNQTIEHLNILDADVYFRLTDILLSKDIAGGLLMLDDILQRGFEGDVIINGFAEHFRDLLLCKDIRMAQLLDVPEDHKKIFYEKSQIIPSSYILSALNILNESELGYRNALNKRLHVELCFIKLAYLNDVLNLEASAADSKKKRPEPEQVTVRQSPPVLQQTPQAPEPRKTAGSQPQPAAVIAENTSVPIQQAPQATTLPPVMPASAAVPPPVTAGKRPKLGRNMLQDVQARHEAEANMPVVAAELSQELAVQLIREFSDGLRNNEQVAMATQLAQMEVVALPPDEIKLCCVSTINYHFGNNLRDRILDFCKEKTKIFSLRITLFIDESKRKEPEIKVMSRSDVFEQMALKNPALRTLKDSLNLQIEL